MNQVIVMTHDDVARTVEQVGLENVMRDLINELRADMILSHHSEQVDAPARSGFSYESPTPGLVEWMTLHRKQETVFLKAVGYHPDNPARLNLPSVISTLCDFDPTCGRLRAICDGALMTAMRTCAASAIATDLLASVDATELGLIGCGAQSVTQFHAISQVRDIQLVRVFDIDSAAAYSFADRTRAIRKANVAIEVVSIDEVVRSSEIISTATSIPVGAGPLFQDQLTRPGLHINAVGSDFPGKIELPQSLLKRSGVFPDFLDQALVEGECQQLSLDEVGLCLPELLRLPDKAAGARDRVSVFDSTGWALEDQVALRLIIRAAQQALTYRTLEFDACGLDPHDPYQGVVQQSELSQATPNHI